tara:strand:+ start:373 stop:549 length:177 start_codon:yes stop_codon:yes gene_type:complete
VETSYGIALFFIGCTVTVLGFFIAFLVVNYNKKKELRELEDKKKNKIFPHHYYGDDTV